MKSLGKFLNAHTLEFRNALRQGADLFFEKVIIPWGLKNIPALAEYQDTN